jgi:RNA polymerase sigma factor (sigma-70 family)
LHYPTHKRRISRRQNQRSQMQKIKTAIINNNGAIEIESPWLDTRGFPLSDAELKFISPLWDAETWELYLKWYESPLSESQIYPREFDEIAERQCESIFRWAQEFTDSPTQRLVRLTIENLPPRQREVIELTYWQGLSERTIAFDLRISRNAVRKLKSKGLKRICASLRRGLPTFPLVRGEIHSLDIPTGRAHDKNVLDLAQGAIPKAS